MFADCSKTATMVELAHQQADRRNIFFIHANDKSSLDKAYLDIARRIGPEYLMKEFRGRDVEGIWRNENPEGRVERFTSWLNDPENENALLLFDDIDGVKGLDERGTALPHEAKIVLYTTRDPVFSDLGFRSRRRFRISSMEIEDIIKIMEGIRDQEMIDRQDSEKTSDLYHRETLLQIAETVYGHPLAASIAIKYIVRVISQNKAITAGAQFVAKLQSNSFEGRRRFLDFSPEVPSIMDTFRISQKRLRQPEGEAWKLLQFHGMIETESSDDFDPREFFFTHSCPITTKDFLDSDVLGAESFHLRELFSELEAVSFGERLAISKPMVFHPLWLECTRHAMGPNGRLRYARQILQVCYHSIFNQPGKISQSAMERRANNFLAHVRRCLEVCKNFKISLQELNLSEPIQTWIECLAPPCDR